MRQKLLAPPLGVLVPGKGGRHILQLFASNRSSFLKGVLNDMRGVGYNAFRVEPGGCRFPGEVLSDETGGAGPAAYDGRADCSLKVNANVVAERFQFAAQAEEILEGGSA